MGGYVGPCWEARIAQTDGPDVWLRSQIKAKLETCRASTLGQAPANDYDFESLRLLNGLPDLGPR